tara:strand:+ start:228 stop:713 length:486 start_codon:yes stop_codon:yes gene_type:complete
MNFRIGNGIDCHELVPNKKLILGGILIDSKLGSSGHSDGDAVIHALVDSMLGALALGDIGTFFPSNEKKWKNADSSIFLDFAKKKIIDYGYVISNTDITIVLQSPYLKDYIYDIRNSLATTLDITISSVSVKATTTDKLGFVGKNKGVVALVSTLLMENVG